MNVQVGWDPHGITIWDDPFQGHPYLTCPSCRWQQVNIIWMEIKSRCNDVHACEINEDVMAAPRPSDQPAGRRLGASSFIPRGDDQHLRNLYDQKLGNNSEKRNAKRSPHVFFVLMHRAPMFPCSCQKGLKSRTLGDERNAQQTMIGNDNLHDDTYNDQHNFYRPVGMLCPSPRVFYSDRRGPSPMISVMTIPHNLTTRQWTWEFKWRKDEARKRLTREGIETQPGPASGTTTHNHNDK